MHHSEQHKYLIPMAKDMGVTLYQRFCEKDAAKFLQIQTDELVALRRKKQIGFLQVTHHQIEYFGVHLLEFLHSSSHTTSESTPHKKADVILRMPQVAQITGLSRTTLWRYEREGIFPTRVALGGGSVGWYQSDVEQWLYSRKKLEPLR